MFHALADFLTYQVFGLSVDQPFTVAMNFFLYGVTKIMVLIWLVIFVISLTRTYLAPGKVKAFMARAPKGVGNLVASLFGAVTPFCSCSSIPLFLGFLKARIPAGVALSFLITSPLVNEVAVVMMGGLFGWRLAFLYALSGILLGVVGGLILGAFGLDKDIILEDEREERKENGVYADFSSRARYALTEAKKTFVKLVWYVLGGLAVGAIIRGYVPQEFFVNSIGQYESWSVPIAVLLGMPIYAGCSMIVPIIFSITVNGVPLGTSLAFMMAIAGLSLPEAIILKRVMKLRLLVVFFGMVAVGIVVIGYLFNWLWMG